MLYKEKNHKHNTFKNKHYVIKQIIQPTGPTAGTDLLI